MAKYKGHHAENCWLVGKSESTRMVEDLWKVKVLWSLRWAVPPEVEGDRLAFERERDKFLERRRQSVGIGRK